MPAAYQGTAFRSQGAPIADIASPNFVEPAQQRARLDFIETMNRMHPDANGGDSELAARIDSYELAFRMQSKAPDAVDLTKEADATRKLYGFDDPVCLHFAHNCLMARRLARRPRKEPSHARLGGGRSHSPSAGVTTPQKAFPSGWPAGA
jgi:hypothetical protein